MGAPRAFLSDITEIRRRARQHLSEGAVTQNYGGKVEDAIALLNHAVATEIVCILRYKFHAACATGLASEALKEEFAQHAREEEEHLVASETYREMVRHFGDRDPTTRCSSNESSRKKRSTRMTCMTYS